MASFPGALSGVLSRGRPTQPAFGQLSDPSGKGLQAGELALRTFEAGLGGGLLEGQLKVEFGHCGTGSWRAAHSAGAGPQSSRTASTTAAWLWTWG